MNMLLVLIPISMLLLGIAIAAFVWAVKRGQFDDLDSPAIDILVDDEYPDAAQAADTTRDAEQLSSDTTTSRHDAD